MRNSKSNRMTKSTIVPLWRQTPPRTFSWQQNLSKILLKKSSMRMEIDVDVEEPDEKELEAEVKTTTDKLCDNILRN